MNKALFVLILLMVTALFLAGCAKDDSQLVGGQQSSQSNTAANDTTDTYVDEQLIDENESVEIGEMI